MTIEEFNNIRNELIKEVIIFEQTERKISILNNLYLMQFSDILEQERYLLFENDCLIKSIAKLKDGSTIDEVKSFLDGKRTEFDSIINSFRMQCKTALETEEISSKFSKNDLEKVENQMIDYCNSYHPFVNIFGDVRQNGLYGTLIMLYRLGNVTGFNNFLKEIEPLLAKADIKPNDYERTAKIYKDTINRLRLIHNEKIKAFPLNKEEIFYKEELMTREEMYLREKNYQARDINKALQNDFKLNFPFEFSI